MAIGLASWIGLARVMLWAFGDPAVARADDVRWSKSRPAIIIRAEDFIIVSGRTFNVGELLNQHEEMWQARKERNSGHR